MENRNVRRIDVFNLLQYVIKKWLVIGIIAVLAAGVVGGYNYFLYKVEQKNMEFYNANKVELVYSAFGVYVTNFDESDYFANRIDDVTSMIKGYTCLNRLIEEAKIEANYYQMVNSVAVISSGINGLEISLEGSLIGLDQEQVTAATKIFKNIVMDEFDKNFGKGTLVLVDDVHPNAYVLEKAVLSDGEKEKKITKKSVVKNGVIGGIVGGVLGIVAVVFYTLVSTVLRGHLDVLECYGYPLFGELTKNADNQEEYKRIAKRVSNAKTIAVSSVLEVEGRSEVSNNLAEKLAINGKKALLVTISKEAIEAEQNVLYKYILGTASAKELVGEISDGVSKALWSPVNVDSVDVFEHAQFKTALEELSKEYDYVIMDCPAARDSSILLSVAALSPLSLVVAKDGVVKESQVVKFKNELEENQITNLGLIYVG